MPLDIFSIILAMTAALCAGLVGGFAQLKRIVLAGDVMSHIALPGLGLALLYHVNPFVGGATTLAIGVIFAASVAIGALVTPEGDLIDALFGGSVAPTGFEFTIGLIVAFAIVILVTKFHSKFILSFFSPELAAATGISTDRVNLLFLLIFGATILLGLQFLGALLMGSLIIIPAAIARQLTHRLDWFMALSALLSMLSTALGLVLASRYGFPLGPTIVTVAAALFALSLLKKKD